jgi:hypothetical protein
MIQGAYEMNNVLILAARLPQIWKNFNVGRVSYNFSFQFNCLRVLNRKNSCRRIASDLLEVDRIARELEA